jgi:hypothetical protein
VAPGDHELEPDAEAVQRRATGSDLAHRGDGAADAAWLVLVSARLERDVVAEPLGLLVRVGMTPDIDEQGRVVDDRALVLAQADALAEAQRDEGLAQHVLHRLAEAEVDAERQGRDELRQADVGAVGLGSHAASLSGQPSRQLS